MAAVAVSTKSRVSDTSEYGVSANAGIDTLMRQFYDKTQAERPKARKPVEVSSSPQSLRDFGMASDVLEQASRAFDDLMDQYKSLEYELEETRASADRRAEEQETLVAQLRSLALNLKDQVDLGEQKLAAMTSSCEAAEARASQFELRMVNLENEVSASAEHAAVALSLSTKLHDKVVGAFGIGSRVHPALQAATSRGLK